MSSTTAPTTTQSTTAASPPVEGRGEGTFAAWAALAAARLFRKFAASETCSHHTMQHTQSAHHQHDVANRVLTTWTPRGNRLQQCSRSTSIECANCDARRLSRNCAASETCMIISIGHTQRQSATHSTTLPNHHLIPHHSPMHSAAPAASSSTNPTPASSSPTSTTSASNPTTAIMMWHTLSVP